MKLEICVDNYEALETAVGFGADRIELCASLIEGGLTPPISFIHTALKIPIPVFVMVRPRSCDFLYTSEEIEMMHHDIRLIREMGAPGVVFGVLTAEGRIDVDAMRSLVREAGEMNVTCHRAVDQVKDVFSAMDDLITIGVRRVLTTGQAPNPYLGIPVIHQMVAYAKGRIGIMAAGVEPDTVAELVQKTGVDEVHAATSIPRLSSMLYVKDTAKMGAGEDFTLNVVDGSVVRAIKQAIGGESFSDSQDSGGNLQQQTLY